MSNLNSKKERVYGIDLLRVILSLWVVMIHVLFFGGPITKATIEDHGFYVAWFMGSAIICTVNCFALVSGYVMYNQTFKYTTVLRYYLAVLYHGLVITLIVYLRSPWLVTSEEWLQALLPVSHSEFWYFSSYFCLFFFMPVLIQGMRSLSKKQASTLVVSLLLVLSVLPHITDSDPFLLNQGFSALWLAGLFVIGTYLGKYGEQLKLSKSTLVACYVVCVCVSFLGIVLSEIIPSLEGRKLIDYNAPTTAIAAIALVLLFAGVSVPKPIAKISRFCAPFSLSIYLLHEQPLVRQTQIMNRFVEITYLPVPQMIFMVLLISLVIWLICFALEFIRKGIFRILRVETLLQKIEDKLNDWGVYQPSEQKGMIFRNNDD